MFIPLNDAETIPAKELSAPRACHFVASFNLLNHKVTTRAGLSALIYIVFIHFFLDSIDILFL